MLDLLFPPKRRADWGGDGFWGGLGFGGLGRVRTQANVEVGPDNALTYGACWRASQILSSTVASLPLITYRHLPGGNKEQARDHELYDVLHDIPNPDMDAMVFREGRTVHQLNWGNGFAEIQRGRKGEIASLWPIHPSRVRPIRRDERDTDGRPLLPTYRYRVRNNDGSEVVLRADEMLHIPGSHSDDGIWGKGVVAHARESIGMGLATERHGATYFGNGAQPPAVVSGAGFKDPDARKAFRAEWKQIHGSPDSGEIAILQADAKLEKLTYPPEDSQFLQTRVHNVREIARWYGVPVHMLGDLEKASYNSIEQLGIEFVCFSLLQWLKRWEGQITLKLIRPEDRRKLFVQHDVSALIHGDITARYTSYQIGLTKGFLSINDVRRLLNLNSIGPLGDKYRVELNTTTLEMAGLPPPPKSITINDNTAKAKPGETPTPAGETPAKLLEVPENRQEHDFDCGAACTKSVAEYFGVGEERTEEDYIDELDTKPVSTMSEQGTHPRAIIDWFSDRGLTVTSGSGWTLDDLRRFWSAGQPVIVPIQDYGTEAEYRVNQSGHYVVVIGLWGGYVFVQDPSSANAEAGGDDKEPDSVQDFGRVMIREERFLEVWHDVEGDGRVDVCYGIAVGRGFAAPAPTSAAPAGPPAKPAEDKTEPSPGPADSDSRDRGTTTAEALAAVQPVLAATLTRMFAKEAKAVSRAIDRPDFDSWLADFHAKHEATVNEALAPVLPALVLGGVQTTAGALASRVIAESRNLLLLAYNQSTKPQMSERLKDWAAIQAATLTAAILQEKRT